MNKMASQTIPIYQILKKPIFLLYLPVSRIEEICNKVGERYNILIELKSIDLTNPNDSDIFIQIEEK